MGMQQLQEGLARLRSQVAVEDWLGADLEAQALCQLLTPQKLAPPSAEELAQLRLITAELAAVLAQVRDRHQQIGDLLAKLQPTAGRG